MKTNSLATFTNKEENKNKYNCSTVVQMRKSIIVYNHSKCMHIVQCTNMLPIIITLQVNIATASNKRTNFQCLITKRT